jgi:hypothetical protein
MEGRDGAFSYHCPLPVGYSIRRITVTKLRPLPAGHRSPPMRKILSFILNLQKRTAVRRMKRKGFTPDQAAAESIVSGRAWEEFCDTLKAAGGSILGFESPDDPFTRTEGFRYLSRLVRAGLENFVEGGDPGAPVLRRLVHETVKMGNDNPDFYYRSAVIDGNRKYRIAGTLGTTPFIIFSTQDGDYTDSGGTAMPLAGQLTTDDMLIGKNGEVEIILSNEKEGDNWLRTTAETRMIMVRELSGDRERETASDLRVEPMEMDSGTSGHSIFSPSHLEDGLAKAGQLVAGASLMFARWSRDFAKTTNELPRFNQAKSDAAGGDPHMAYYHSYWNLDEGRALVVEAMPPECATWNFVLANHWLESLDYRYGQIHVNKHTARYRPDGSVRIIICRENPGLPNWLDPQGHNFGSMCFRWNRAESHPQPQIRSMPLDGLKAFLEEESINPAKKIDYNPAQPAGRGGPING